MAATAKPVSAERLVLAAARRPCEVQAEALSQRRDVMVIGWPVSSRVSKLDNGRPALRNALEHVGAGLEIVVGHDEAHNVEVSIDLEADLRVLRLVARVGRERQVTKAALAFALDRQPGR